MQSLKIAAEATWVPQAQSMMYLHNYCTPLDYKAFKTDHRLLQWSDAVQHAQAGNKARCRHIQRDFSWCWMCFYRLIICLWIRDCSIKALILAITFRVRLFLSLFMWTTSATLWMPLRRVWKRAMLSPYFNNITSPSLDDSQLFSLQVWLLETGINKYL